LASSSTYDAVLYDSFVDLNGRWKRDVFENSFKDKLNFRVLPVKQYSDADIDSRLNPGYTYSEKDVIGFLVGYRCGRFGQYSMLSHERKRLQEGKMTRS
jgi:hypothetical protein